MSTLLQKVANFVLEEYSRPVWNNFEYHNIDHIQNVVGEVKSLGKKSGLSEDNIANLQIAAWFHDLGYEKGVVDHEETSCEIAKEFLISENVSENIISEIVDLIKATRPGFESFETISQKIIRDADLSNAGLKGFKKCSNALRAEWVKIQDRQYDDEGWYNLQIDYLTNLEFLSKAAKKKYSKRRKKNLKKYKKRLTKLSD